jgi:hypothetical protein
LLAREDAEEPYHYHIFSVTICVFTQRLHSHEVAQSCSTGPILVSDDHVDSVCRSRKIAAAIHWLNSAHAEKRSPNSRR